MCLLYLFIVQLYALRTCDCLSTNLLANPLLIQPVHYAYASYSPGTKKRAATVLSQSSKSRVFEVVSRATGTFVASLTDSAFIQEAS